MEPSRNALLERLALFLEREARLIGADIEPETTKIIAKLRRKHEAEPQTQTCHQAPLAEL